MAIKQILLVLCSCVFVSTYAYNWTTYNSQIEERCLHRLKTLQNPYGDIQLLGLTMESFISMVEKVERNHNDWDIYTLSKVLLERFAFEGVVYKDTAGGRRPSQKTEDKYRWEVIKELVGGDGTTHTKFNEEDLNEAEKCTMFFMMGHLVNSTYRAGIDERDTSVVPQDASASGSMMGQPLKATTTPRTSKPREQGVVTFKGQKNQAISVSKILNAIVASQHNGDHSITELYPRLRKEESLNDKRINGLIGVTLGDVLSYAALHQIQGTSGLDFFGPLGEWNSTICPDEFHLSRYPRGTTNALLRGAIDGLLISNALINLKSRTSEKDLQLSRLLRGYYTNKGIPRSNGGVGSGYSHCRRNEVTALGGGGTGILESATSFLYVHDYIENSQILENADQKIQSAYSELQSAINAMSQNDREIGCGTDVMDAENPICETPSNVFVIMDQSELRTEGFFEQQEIVQYLTNKMDIGIGAGSMNVFSNSRNGEELRAISYNDSNPTCSTCHALRPNSSHFGSQESEISILDGLNKTLTKFEREIDLLPGVPSKVAVWFHYEDIKENDKNRLNKAVNMVRHGHRDTRVLLIGRNDDVLKQMAQDPSDVFKSQSATPDFVNRLSERICKVPAVLQYNNCWRRNKDRNENLNTYEGYVTEGHVQYWAMYPEYFLKSYDIEIKFTAHESDSIKVCEGRADENPKRNCKIPEKGHNTVSFRYKDPCHKHSVESCPPINFAVIGLPSTSSALRKFDCPANDPKCRKIDQIKFTVSHTGIACSGSEFLKSSPIVLLVVALTYFFKNSR